MLVLSAVTIITERTEMPISMLLESATHGVREYFTHCAPPVCTSERPAEPLIVFISHIATMPKFFCDYCDVYLTHDSMSVRKSHNTGRNHLRNVTDYYQQIGHEKAQSVIDSITSSYAAEGQPNPMLQTPGGAPGFAPMGFPGQ